MQKIKTELMEINNVQKEAAERKRKAEEMEIEARRLRERK